MNFGKKLVSACVDRPKTVTAAMLLATLLVGALATVPSIWPEKFPFLHGVMVDTDPENMLPADEPVRVYHKKMKDQLALYDMVVLGIVNEKHSQGVFNVDSLRKIHALTDFVKDLQWPDPEHPGQTVGVIAAELISPSTVDSIGQGATPRTIKFEWLMRDPPENQAQALALREKASKIPLLYGTLVSDNEPGGQSKAICLYLPLTDKHLSYKVYSAINHELQKPIYGGDEQYFITGLPVAENTFGVEMFKQMALSAPAAMAVIFILMLVFFHRLTLVISPMIVAMVSVIITMGLLIASGNTIHIMSSMIPIFIMPIAVLDAVHILSDFFDRYQETRDRKKTIIAVMDSLYTPMLYTSLTTAVAFGSLALTPIPPVQVFGLFVALGVMLAWLLTVTFVPAFVMFLSPRRLENFGLKKKEGQDQHHGLMSRMLAAVGRFTGRKRGAISVVVGMLILSAVAVFGILRININDNPVKWFQSSHPIRVADKVLNKHFAGTYMGYLAFEGSDQLELPAAYFAGMSGRLDLLQKKLSGQFPVEKVNPAFSSLRAEAAKLIALAKAGGPWRTTAAEQSLPAWKPEVILGSLKKLALDNADEVEDDEQAEVWEELETFLGLESLREQVFKQPEVLRYIAGLQKHLGGPDSVVGKSSSLSDVVSTVYRELLGGQKENYKIPASVPGVAQCLIQYQNSHRPNDIWHFVTRDFRKTSLWLQLKSGDNRDMEKVIAQVDKYVQDNPPPMGLRHQWFGLTYINVVWQEKMVRGMMMAFLGSFLVVLLMMTLLFRSALWGLLSMVPLTMTIALIYGAIGYLGKDYDMPVAVLSSLSLGLAVDYAIHFLARGRELRGEYGSWKAASGPVFGEPARAISRNVIVIGLGFLPLLAATLVPYQTVGIFIAAILLVAGVASLLILPSLITLFEKMLFPQTRGKKITCMCGTCLISAITFVALIAVNVYQFVDVKITPLAFVSFLAMVLLAGICAWSSRREGCTVTAIGQPEEKQGDE
jgi:uncharacterized protein